MNCDMVIARLESMGSERDRQGMGYFGINVDNALGISIYELRKVAKEIGKDHDLALQLWDSGIHEARILASYIEDPHQMTEAQMERWVADFDSWDLCDQVCGLFEETPFVHQKIDEWSRREEEFVKRASFALIAGVAVHDKKAPDELFEGFFLLIVEQSKDDRNFVKKAVNWALRNVGKRNHSLNQHAIAIAAELKGSSNRAARWIGSNAYRELTSNKVQDRLNRQLACQ
jgi:3-methyladenine DNA glycosylase AlkD